MNLTTPIPITFTEQRVLDVVLDREHDFIRVKIAMVTSTGIAHRQELVFDKFTAAVPAVMDGETVVTPARPAKGGDGQRLIVNPNPIGMGDLFLVQTYSTGSNALYQSVNQARKQNNELAALESAGLADGWLFPGTP